MDQGQVSVAPKDLEEIRTLLNSNLQLIKYGAKAASILTFQAPLWDKRTPQKTGSSYIASISTFCILTIMLDKTQGRCYFQIQADKFLTNDGVTFTVSLPPQASHVLGCSVGEKLQIGPVRAGALPITSPRLSNQIYSQSQQPPFALRPSPKLYHVISNVITSRTRDMFLLGGPFEEYHIIYSFTLDEEAISKRFICKLNDEGVYHRIQDIHNVLDVFQFILLDQSFKPIIFAPQCLVQLSLAIRPVHFNLV